MAAEPDELARTFSEIARTLVAEDDPQATLECIVELAVELIDHCDSAGLPRFRR